MIMFSKQRGITVIETLGALFVGTLMVTGLVSMMDTSVQDLKGSQVAHHHAQVVEAARAYIKANYVNLKDAAYQPNIVVAVPLATLRSSNFLPAGIGTKNAYGQDTCLLVRQPVAGSGKLDSLVVTYGGNKIGDKDIAYIASQAGEGNGYITTTDWSNAKGASWSLPTTGYRNISCTSGGPKVLKGTKDDSGHLVSSIFHDGPGQLSTDFLYRHEVPGQPDFNKMHTSIRFVDNAIATEGTDCGPHAALTFNSARYILACGHSGRWERVSTWKSPVATYSALPTTDKDGDVRMVLDKKRAFAYDDASKKWIALAVDEKGDLTVEHDVAVGNDAKIARDLRVTRDVWVDNRAYVWDILSAGYLWSDDWVRGKFFYATDDDWGKRPGTECHVWTMSSKGEWYYLWPVGSIHRSVVDNRMLTCQAEPYSSTGYALRLQNNERPSP